MFRVRIRNAVHVNVLISTAICRWYYVSMIRNCIQRLIGVTDHLFRNLRETILVRWAVKWNILFLFVWRIFIILYDSYMHMPYVPLCHFIISQSSQHSDYNSPKTNITVFCSCLSPINELTAHLLANVLNLIYHISVHHQNYWRTLKLCIYVYVYGKFIAGLDMFICRYAGMYVSVGK